MLPNFHLGTLFCIEMNRKYANHFFFFFKSKTVIKRIRAIKIKISFKNVPLKSVSEIKKRLNATKINRTAKMLFTIFPLYILIIIFLMYLFKNTTKAWFGGFY